METVEYVDMRRFMGDWYVHASVPTIFDKEPFNAVERYALNRDGTIATTYIYQDGAPDGPRKEMSAKGFVRNTETNAVWGMQFVWPIRADYRIVYLDDDYTTAVVARERRDYIWIMSRSPAIPDATLQLLLDFAETIGYERDRIRVVPHGEGEQRQTAG